MNVLLVYAERSFQEEILRFLVHFISIQDTDVLESNDETVEKRS